MRSKLGMQVAATARSNERPDSTSGALVSEPEARAKQTPTILLVGVLPVVVAFLSQWHFIHNHFFERGGYLLDSGWYSAIIYHNGLFPKNPAVAHSVTHYYDLHVSPLVSSFSLLSYLVPVDRITWYAFFQGVLYGLLPLGPFIIFRKLFPRPSGLNLALGSSVAIAFAFSGQVLMCAGYPHFEVAAPALLSVVLASLVAGHHRMAWVALALTVGVREDAGFHAFAALFVLGVPVWLMKAKPAWRRSLPWMLGFSFLASLCAFATQKLIFNGHSLFVEEYIGSPAFSHLSGTILIERSLNFLRECQFIYGPFIGTALAALLFRDARFILGWLAYAPWLAVNFLAVQELKAVFSIYTGFVFVTSLFWVLLVGAMRWDESGRLASVRDKVLLTFLAISLSSTLGAFASKPVSVRKLFRSMAWAHSRDSDAVRTFAGTFCQDKEALGRVLVDHSVAALTLDCLKPDEVYSGGPIPPEVDTVVYFKSGLSTRQVLQETLHSDYSLSYRVGRSPVRLRSRRDIGAQPAWKAELRPVEGLLDALTLKSGSVSREPEGVRITKNTKRGIQIYGPYVSLPSGRYTTTWSLQLSKIDEEAEEIAILDVTENRKVVVREKVLVSRGQRQKLTLAFSLESGEVSGPLEFRIWYHGGAEILVRDFVLSRASDSVPAEQGEPSNGE